ncbi:MAG TPA: SDR family oxidoreductase [Bacteroidota bacterium]|nr:SDR family oxidoreductase [Bacteroidota bacterium]
MKRQDIRGKIIIVAGATGGIGYPACLQLAKMGAVVVAVGRSKSRLESIIRKISGYSPSSIFIESDLSRRESWNEIVDQVFDRFHRIDVLVNCAGVLIPGTLDTLSDKEVESVICLNFSNCVRSARAVVPVMKKQHSGQILFVGSLGGIVPMPYEALYSATKFAVRGLSRSLQSELRRYEICVSHLSPGPVRTSMLAAESADRLSTISFALKPLDAGVVASAIVDLIERPREEKIIPGWQGAFAFMLNISPKVFSLLSPLLHAVGRRNRRQFRDGILSRPLVAGDLR